MPAPTTSLYLTTSTGAPIFRLDHVVQNNVDVGLQENGWSPAVADYAAGTLGGVSPYDLLEEVFTIDLGGAQATAAGMHGQMRILYQLRDLATQWMQNETTTTVLLVCQLQGSDLPLLQAAVEAIEIKKPANYTDMLMVAEVEGVEVTVRHRAWLGTSESQSASAVAVPNVALVDFGPANTDPCVADVTISGFTTDIPSGYLLLGPTLDHLPLIQAEAATSTSFTSAPSVANDATASGGQILRILQQTALSGGILTFNTGSSLGALYTPGMDAPRQADVYLMLRNTDLLEQWTLQAYVEDIGGPVNADREVTIGADAESPTVVFLGVIRANASAFGAVKIRVTSTQNRSGLTLDLDYLALRVAAPIGSQTIQILNLISLAGSSISPWRLIAQSNALSRPQPALRAMATSGPLTERAEPSYRGDPLVLSQGSSLVVRFLAPWKNAWRYSAVNPTVSADRRPLYPGVF